MTTKPESMDQFLQALFYRQSCPSADTLGDYHLGILPPGQRLAVAQHLRLCPHCDKEFSLYAMDDADTGFMAQLQRMANQVRWAVAAPSPTPVPVRGAGDSAHTRRVFQSDGIEALITTRPAQTGYQRWNLMGRLQPVNAGKTVELWDEQQSLLIDTQSVDEGYFDFPQLRSGDYVLCLKADNVETWLGPIAVQGQTFSHEQPN